MVIYSTLVGLIALALFLADPNGEFAAHLFCVGMVCLSAALLAPLLPA